MILCRNHINAKLLDVQNDIQIQAHLGSMSKVIARKNSCNIVDPKMLQTWQNVAQVQPIDMPIG